MAKKKQIISEEDKELIILKAVSDFQLGREYSDEIIKAMTNYLGSVKQINGRWYVWSTTKNGTQNWRLLHRTSKTLLTVDEVLDRPKVKKIVKKLKDKKAALEGLDDDEEAELSEKEKLELAEAHIDEDTETLDVNDLIFEEFPQDIKSLVHIKFLGGSTGADLYEDPVTGDKFVIKKGATKDHAYEEYLANKIYEKLGVKVPEVRWYDDGTDHALVSRYIEDLEPFSPKDSSDEELIGKDFLADALMSNWDAYMNDNVQRSKTTGDIYRMDNGGSLRFRARGKLKGTDFGDDVMKDVASLKQHNQWVRNVSQDEVMQQAFNLIPEKTAVLDFLIEEGLKDSDLFQTLEKRFDSLDRLVNMYKVQYHTISDVETTRVDNDYRDLTDEELEDCLKQCNNNLHQTSHNGWKVLNILGALRGFTNKPFVLEDTDFKQYIADKDVKMCNRGTNKQFAIQWMNSDDCWYGQYAAYGAGVYSTLNKTKELGPPPPKHLDSWREAKGYADNTGGEKFVMDVAFTKDFKAITGKEIQEMIDNERFGKAYVDITDKITANMAEQAKLEKENKDVDKNIIQKVLSAHPLVDQSKKNNILLEPIRGDETTESFVDKMLPHIQEIGGDIKPVAFNRWNISLPYTDKVFTIQRTMAKQGERQHHNSYYEAVKGWVIKHHYGVVDEEIDIMKRFDKTVKTNLVRIKEIVTENRELNKKASDIQRNGNAGLSAFQKEILNSGGAEKRGFYAMYKGYDGIIEERGNEGNEYMIILNRSKCVVRHNKTFDYGHVS